MGIKNRKNGLSRFWQNDFSFEEQQMMDKLLVDSASNDIKIAQAAQRELAVAAQPVIRRGVLEGDVVGNIFTPINFKVGQEIVFPLDFIVPGTEKNYKAYTIPNHGRIPEAHIEGDLVTVSVYDVGSSIDWLLKFARDARWDIVGRGLAVLESTFVRKQNLDAWNTLIGAAVDRNLIVYDSAAAAGFFTKRLVSLMKTAMQRGGGGNLASQDQVTLTDIWLSPESLEDVRTWDLTQVDDVTRREIFVADNYGLTRVFGVNLHPMNELGVGQAFQLYFASLGGTLQGDDTEIVVGMDLSDPDVFVNPIRAQIEIFEDEQLHRQRRQGYYGWGEHGFAVLDNRRVILGSL